MNEEAKPATAVAVAALDLLVDCGSMRLLGFTDMSFMMSNSLKKHTCVPPIPSKGWANF